LEIIGIDVTQSHHIGINRIKHLTRELEKEGVNVNFHSLPLNYKAMGPKIIKRILLRNTLYKQIIKCCHDKNPKNTIFMVSSPPTIHAPILKPLSKKFCTILDLRDHYREWDYHPFLKLQYEKWEQKSTQKKVEAIIYVHEGFKPFFIEDKIDQNKTFFVTNGANENIFTFKGKEKKLSNSSINLIYAGGIANYHNVPKWIEVMKELHEINADVHLTIIGKGNDAINLEQKMKKYNLPNISYFKEFLPQSELAENIRGADYALVSTNVNTKVYYDVVIQTKVFESLCCGTPVLSFSGKAMDDFSKNFEYCKNWNSSFGLNYREIANQIIDLPKLSSTQRRDLAIKSQSNFSFKNIAIKFKKVLELSLLKYQNK